MDCVRLLAFFSALCVASSAAFAQAATGELRPGITVRIRADSSGPSRIKGMLISATRDSLVLATEERQIAVARRDVRVLDLKRRRARSSGALRMATWFGVIGAGLFGPASLGDEEYQCGNDQCRTEGGEAAQIALIGVAFALWGQGIGALWPGSEWLPVTPVASATGNVRPPLRGNRVRVTAPGFTAPDLEGDVANATSDSLALLVRSSVVNIPMAAITRLEIADGENRARGALRGLLQAVPVAAFYVALGLFDQSTDVYRNGVLQQSTDFTEDALIAAGISLAAGAGIGAVVAPPAWTERRTSTSLLVTPDPRHRALRVGLAIRY